MKTNITFFIAILFTFQILAQTNGLNYKAIVKDAAGDVLVSTAISVEFRILENVTQTLVYTEQHNVLTDLNGLISLVIGQGATADTFNDIGWFRFDHYLNVRINSGAGYVDVGTTQFEAVPYALHTEHSDKADVATQANSLILKSGTTTQFSVFYSSSGDKLRITETGVAGNVLEISGGELFLPQYAGANNGPLSVDATGKVVSEVVLPPGPQETTVTRYEFNEKEVNVGSTKFIHGIQFEDGTVLTGIKSLIMDNNTMGSTGIGNTAFVGVYRRLRIDNTLGEASSITPIYRIDANDTATGMFEEFTQTTLAQTGSNIIDNVNYIYLVQIWHCDDCDVIEFSVLH